MYLRDQPNESVNAKPSLSGELISKGWWGGCIYVCVALVLLQCVL